MSRRLLVPEDVKHYRWLLELDSPFQTPSLPRGFDYETEVDGILELIWSPRMAEVLGIDLDRFRKITKVQVVQQKRDLLDVALTFGPIPSSRTLLSAMDRLLEAENSGCQPIDIRPPALKALPVRVEATGNIEVWCGAAAAVRSDVALVHADIDLTHRRVTSTKETSIRAHSIAGPRLRTDCKLLKGFFEVDFLPGSAGLTRGYFAASRYLVHAVPPRTDDGVWKHTLGEVVRCYEALWDFSVRLKAKRIAIQAISLGQTPRLEEASRNILLDQINRFCASREDAPTICLVAQTAAESVRLAAEIRRQRLRECLRGEGGFLPATSPGERLSPGTRGLSNSTVLTANALANRSSTPTVGFSSPRSNRLT